MTLMNKFPNTSISCLSTHLSWVRNFFGQKSRFMLYCLNMSSRVICRECTNFLRLTFNVSLLMFGWNVSNNRRSSSYICPAFVWTLDHRNWSSMSRTMLCRASKPFKLALLSISTNVLIGWVLSSTCGSSSIRIVSKTFRMAPSLTSHYCPNACLLGMFGLLNFAMISHCWASVKHVASSFIRLPLRFIESKGLETDMSKVRTYQLSAHPRLRFKVRT